MLFDVGLLILRILFGAGIAAHGAQKLFGSFGGYGLKGTAGFLEQLGFRPGYPFAVAAAVSEFGGGVLLIAGLLTPVGAGLVLSAMLVAMISVHWKNGFFGMSNGIEMAYLYAAAALGIAFTGAGVFSLDQLLGLSRLLTIPVIAGVIFISALGAFLSLASRHRPQQQKAEQLAS